MSARDTEGLTGWKVRREGYFKTLYKFYSQNPFFISTIVMIALFLFVMLLSLPYYTTDFNNFYPQILAEAHGLVFDVGVLGILLVWIERRREKILQKKKYLEEIEDFKYWKNHEAGYRAIGNIRRLNLLGVTKFDMDDYYLENINISNLDFTESSLNNINANNAVITNSILANSSMAKATFKHCTIRDGSFKNCYLGSTDFTNSRIIKIDLSSCFMINVVFDHSYIIQTNLQGCVLIGASFKGAILNGVDLQNTVGLTVEILLEVKSMMNVLLDSDLEKKLQATKVTQTASTQLVVR